VIEPSKLRALPLRLRGRKVLALLAEPHDPEYDRVVVDLALDLLGEESRSVPMELRDRTRLRHQLAQHLGLDLADWDFQAPPDRQGSVRRFPIALWLDDVRSPFNLGSLVRTAEAYGFEACWHSPGSPGINHPRAQRTAMGAEKHLEVRGLSLAEVQALWGERPVFALELGGTDLGEFSFPGEGLVLVGGEELGLSPEALAWADRSAGRVSLPLYGRKASLNVGVAFGILAAAWTAHLSSDRDDSGVRFINPFQQ
jgi:RNA methyltransferase, TrmH family